MLTTRCEGETFMRNLFQNEEFELDVLEAYKKSRWVKTTTTTTKTTTTATSRDHMTRQHHSNEEPERKKS